MASGNFTMGVVRKWQLLLTLGTIFDIYEGYIEGLEIGNLCLLSVLYFCLHKREGVKMPENLVT